ncbi:MAG: hypothetical protein RLZZ241_2276 [Bacteroidota bacterium]|jgi:cytoplasmic iron level regulating protein YaaA (DUF328/UPF0246 family)
MKILLSPAKSLDYETPLPTGMYSDFHFQAEAAKINKILKSKKPAALRKLMSISEELAQLNWQRNQDFLIPYQTAQVRPAVFAFSGDVYQGFDAYTLAEEHYQKMQESVRILSGLYGVLRPLDRILPYRLEMGTALKVGAAPNLYAFWKTKLTDYLNEELEGPEVVVNLASTEYYKALDAKKINAEIITPVFKDWNKGKLSVISFFAKRARGAMARYLVESGATTLEGIREFKSEGYQFSASHSPHELTPVFIR